MRRFPWFWLSLLLPAAGLIWLVWGTQVPLGVAGEWTWPRADLDGSLVLSLLLPLLAAAGYLGFVHAGHKHIGACGAKERAGWLAGLAACGFAWLWVAQESAPEGFQLSKAVWVLYYPGPSGYFTEARKVTGVGEFLARYEQRMAEGDVLHIGTHPPGLIVGYRALMALCGNSPAVTDVLLRTQPASVRESFDLLDRFTRNSPAPLRREDRAVLWLAALIVQFAAAVTVWPLYALVRRHHDARASWLAVSFWPAVPALAIFLPKSDVLYPLLGTLLLWLWMEGCSRRSAGLCLFAGFVFWFGMGLSLALLPVAFLAGPLTLWEGWIADQKPGFLIKSGFYALIRGLAWGVIGFGIPCLITWLVTGLNLLAVWGWNYRNHAAFYGRFPRTYWKWILVNPLEFAVAAGLPLTILVLWSAGRLARQPRSREAGMLWAALMTWGCLLLSGKNLGEAARLWIFSIPWLVCVSAPLFADATGPTGRTPASRSPLIWWIGLACQLGVTLALVTRVAGFHVPTP